MARAPRRARDYAAEYRRRQEVARSKGYSGYYERRTRAAPGGVKPPPAELAQRRGHARDTLLRALRDGPPRLLVLGRDYDTETGEWGTVEFFLRTQDDDELEFTRHRVDREALAEIAAAIEDGGGADVITVVGSPADLVGALT